MGAGFKDSALSTDLCGNIERPGPSRLYLDAPDRHASKKSGVHFQESGFHLPRLGDGRKVRRRGGTQELVFLDHGCDPDARGGEWCLHSDDASGKTHADRIRKRDMRRKCERDLDAGTGSDYAIEIEEDAARADVLGFGEKLAGGRAVETNGGGQSHVETSHRSAVWGCWQHGGAFSATVVSQKHS